MTLYGSPYSLRPKADLNAKTSNQVLTGLLLKVDFGDGVGYSALQTWPSLGEPSLKDLQQLLVKAPVENLEVLWAYLSALPEVKKNILSKAIEYAALDYEARKAKVHILDWFPSVPNNFVLPVNLRKSQNTENFPNSDNQKNPADVGTLNFSEIPKDVETLKIKLNANFADSLPTLEKLAQQGFTLRLDFNASLNLTQYHEFLKLASPALKKSIEYIEDPLPYSSEWAQVASEVPLALDQEFNKVSSLSELAGVVKVLVLKPAKQDIAEVVSQCAELPINFVITNNMDHPISTVLAYYEACRWQHKMPERFLTSGCRTEHLFEYDTAFTLNYDHNQLLPPLGAGVGFDRELEKIKWQKIEKI